MSDRDPRPMPPEVQRAYRDPVDLRGLLMSSVYSESDRRDVLESLMRLLIAKYGDVWIAAGSKEVRVSTRVKAFKKNAARAIRLLRGIEEYGGGEGVDALLAQAMEPRWLAWWENFEWRSRNDVEAWRDVSVEVLGQRQFVWLMAQYARTIIDMVAWQYRDDCVRAIAAAEEFARVPSKANSQAARRQAARIEDARLGASAYPSSLSAHVVTFSVNGTANQAVVVAQAVAITAYGDDAFGGMDIPYNPYDAADTTYAAEYTRLANLTKRMLTPTLITRPSSGLSASGSVFSSVAPVAFGAALGAGAVFLAKRA